MRTLARLVVIGILAIALPGWAQSATELKKELFPKIKKAQADGKDLGEAAEEYKQGDKALADGMQEEAVEHFKKAKSLMPKD
jgi:outer membrane protein assembly factor BamD (BamD/ComL family)